MFQMFDLYQTYVASVFIWMLHMHACCKHMFQVCQVFHTSVASVVSYVSGANAGMHVTTRSVYEIFFWQSSLVFRKSEVETRISLVVSFLLVGDGEGQTTSLFV